MATTPSPDSYIPLDLGQHYNASKNDLPSGDPAPTGLQQFHGLPFLIGNGAAGSPCFLLLDGSTPAPIEIPVNQTAHYLIFAHRLLESRLFDNGPIGECIADYTIRLASGEAYTLPIRERFEIATVPPGWGHFPFLAYPDQQERLWPRQEGRWGHAGSRQTEGIASHALGYFLWPWQNPQPDVSITAITIQPRGPRFLLAAVTLSHLPEHPFPRSGSRPISITLPNVADARQPFALTVHVDRGVSSYPHPLPATSSTTFLSDPQRGWGEAPNRSSSPAYAEITAIPSATLQICLGEESLGTFRWGDLEQAKQLDVSDRLHVELVDHGRNWVRTTITDTVTGRPLPCRVHFRSLEGIPFAPYGHHPHINSGNGTWHIDVGGDVRLGQISYAYVNGTCEGWLPRGDVLVDVAAGFEYEPLRTTVHIDSGQQELHLSLRRIRDMNAERWFSGDTHVHFLSTQGAALEASGEGLNIVNLLLSQWGALFTNTEEFTGQPFITHGGRTIVYATQENRQHMLGHLTLLGLKHSVMPWCTGGLSEAELGGILETTLSAWADACHAQGGTVIIPHLPAPNGEPAALIATGRADAVEMLEHQIYRHNEYYRYLNAGYRLPLVGGTDKMSNDVPVGLYRTYVSIPPDEEFTYENWCRNLRLGRTFLSGGPLIGLRAAGANIGDMIQLPSGGGTIEVDAWTESIFPIHTLQLITNGQVIGETTTSQGAHHLTLHERVRIKEHSWIAARCSGPSYANPVRHHDEWHRGIMAHTSPIYCAVGEPWQRFDDSTIHYMLTLLDGSLAYIRQRSRQYPPHLITHHHGQDDHLAFLERPFHEAIAALHQRLHQHGLSH